jgi:hypothetical protein
MLFTKKHQEKMQDLIIEVEHLKKFNEHLLGVLEIQTARIDALMKAYPHGTTRTGQPRKKPGRKPKAKE